MKTRSKKKDAWGNKMKETKFKVWDVEKQKMFVVDMITFRSNGDVFKVWPPVHDESTPGILINQTSGILIQYTGLKDMDGVEIYEGDRIQTILDDETRLSIFVVEWIEDYARFMMIREKDNERYNMIPDVSKNKKVIGNRCVDSMK